jgi:hypothetical protein
MTVISGPGRANTAKIPTGNNRLLRTRDTEGSTVERQPRGYADARAKFPGKDLISECSLPRLFAYFAWFAVSLLQDATLRKPRTKRNTRTMLQGAKPHRSHGGRFSPPWPKPGPKPKARAERAPPSESRAAAHDSSCLPLQRGSVIDADFPQIISFPPDHQVFTRVLTIVSTLSGIASPSVCASSPASSRALARLSLTR